MNRSQQKRRCGQPITCDGDLAFVEIGHGKWTVIVDEQDAWIAGAHSLSLAVTKTTTYVMAKAKGAGMARASFRLSRVIVGAAEGQIVDHINGNPLDNRRANLRLVTATDNNRNRAKRAESSSRFKGVCRVGGKWIANIYRECRQIRLGRFAAEEEAARAYDTAAREMFGGAAALNFPKVGEQSAHRQRTITYFHTDTDSQQRPHDHA